MADFIQGSFKGKLRNILILSILLMVTRSVHGQSLSPYLVSSGGDHVNNGGIYLSYSIGEPIIQTINDTSIILTQGFHQHFNDATTNTNTNGSLNIYTGFSPNGDGLNDTWIIDNLTNYPKNNVSIFNRWGGKVWHQSGYNNTTIVWDGTETDKKSLPADTYFYVITNDGKPLAKGWVELTK